MGSSLSRARLGTEVVRTGWSLRRRRSLLPSRSYLTWRRATAYGDGEIRPDLRDVAGYLEWRRGQRRIPR
jgi:hypothetical protein